MHQDLIGGDEHPDPDERMLKVLDQIARDEHDPIWMMANFSLRLWSAAYRHIDLLKPIEGTPFRTGFIDFLGRIRSSVKD